MTDKMRDTVDYCIKNPKIYNGKQFRAKINGVEVVGYLCITLDHPIHQLYFCQNVFDGREIPQKYRFGMEKSWALDENVTELTVINSSRKVAVTKLRKKITVVVEQECCDRNREVHFYKGFICFDGSHYIKNEMVRGLRRFIRKPTKKYPDEFAITTDIGWPEIMTNQSKRKIGVQIGCTKLKTTVIDEVISKLVD